MYAFSVDLPQNFEGTIFHGLQLVISPYRNLSFRRRTITRSPSLKILGRLCSSAAALYFAYVSAKVA